jgi:hypothetical protein
LITNRSPIKSSFLDERSGQVPGLGQNSIAQEHFVDGDHG